MNTKKIKVISKVDNANTTDKSLHVQSFSEYEMETDWDKVRVSETLITEAHIEKELAEEIATAVENKLLKMEQERVSTLFIRSLVDEELVIRGRERKLLRQKLLSIPTYDLEQCIFSKNTENSNVLYNTPEAVNMYIAETILKQYAFNRVFNKEVVTAHLTGKIHVHDSSFCTRLYSYDGETNYVVVRNKVDKKEYYINFKNLIDLVDGVEKYNKELDAFEKYPKGWEIEDKDGFVDLIRTVRHKEKQKLLKITLSDGSTVIVTKNHPCIVSGYNKTKVVEASSLTIGDKFLKN